jgi:hypothetical protein
MCKDSAAPKSGKMNFPRHHLFNKAKILSCCGFKPLPPLEKSTENAGY